MMKRIKEAIITLITQNTVYNRAFVMVSLFFCLGLLSPFINILFEIKPAVSDFSQHIISNASVNNLDVSKRVGLFYKLLFALVLGTAAFFLILKKWVEKGSQDSSLLKPLFSIGTIGVLAVFSGFLLYSTDIAVYFIGVSLVCLLLELRFNHTHQKIKLALWPVFVSFPFSLFGYTFLKNRNFFDKITPELKLKGYLIAVDPQTLTFVFLTFFFSFVAYLFFIKFLKNKGEGTVLTASIPLVVTPAILSFGLECLNILNKQLDFVSNSPFLMFALLIILSGVLFFYLLYRKRSRTSEFVQNHFVGIALLSYVILIAQPWRFMIPGSEFFETANHGLAIDHFCKYGSIPFVENFDAHMLNQQFFSYIYILFNGYEPWAHSLYILYFFVLEIIVLYYVFRKALGSVNSFFLILCVPILPVVLNEFALAGILALFVIRLLKDQSFKNHCYFWILGISVCLYKLDVGYSALLSALLLYFQFNKILYRRFEFKNLLKAAVVAVAPLLLLFVLLCLLKGINPIVRLQEFLLAAMSDQNWGITKMGDTSHYLFRVSYYLLPLLTVCFATVIVFKLFFNEAYQKVILKKERSIGAVILFLFFVFFFVLNAQRGIVFHNFEYGNIIRITSTLPIALLFLTLVFGSKNRLLYFSIVFLGTFLFLNSANANFKNRSTSLLTQSVNSASYHEKFLEMSSFGGTRLKVTFDQSEIQFFKKFLDKVLTKDQTYYDFSSTNFYHALTDRKNPVYVNQSPLMLNGDKAQDIEIGYLKEKNITIVLMPIKNNYWHAISEVYVDFKYYKIAEYIYSNFTPLYRMGSFDVYVLKSKKSEYEAKLREIGEIRTDSKVTDFAFLNEASISKNNLAIANENGKTVLKSSGASPFVIGIMNHLRQQGKLKNENLPSRLVLKFMAANTGNIKIYYNLNATETFSEDRTKEFPITVAGENTITMNFGKTPHELMIGMNVESITLEQFEITSDLQGNINQPEKIDYFIGFVPRLWAEESDSEVFAKVKPFQDIVEETTASIEAKNLNTNRKGVFAFIEVETDADMTASVDLSENNISKATYGFSVSAGKHQYAVRVSNGYYWWNTSNPKITFKAEKAVKISKFCLISDDGTKEISFKSNGLTLANLNDSNWINGCSLAYNMVVLDFSPSKEKLLQKHKKIKLLDGRMVTVKGYYVSGNYINITIAEKLEDYVGTIGFPNALEFVD
ncbi:hypothetical protein ABGT15_09570 [Flavobacterium enshiense]|uniref:hypothetical protein n=1 Tax=Flavobacterium enshiense TaxID=1341165 RepID=UPI00345DB413